MFARTRTIAVLGFVAMMTLCADLSAQRRFTIEQILNPGFPSELIAAKKADRIAWIGNERGMRNVYTASLPDFKAVRLTENTKDDGIDLSGIQISDDGSTILFVRGHTANREGWIANPSTDPNGSERAAWIVKTSGGPSWKVGVAANPLLSPDGKWVAFAKDGDVFSVATDRAGRQIDKAETPLFRIFRGADDLAWSPDSKGIAFASDRSDHSFVGVYDLETRKITYLAPGVDRDSNPTWSADSRRVAFIRRPGLPFGAQIASPQTGGGRGGQGGGRGSGTPAGVPGLTQATLKGGHTLAIWVADVATGQGTEIWHNAPNDTAFPTITNLTWASNSVIFGAAPDDWPHYFSVSVTAENKKPIDLTPGQGFAEFIGLSADRNTLYYATSVGDIDRRHIWKTPSAGGVPVQITAGETIETMPVALASGDRAAVLTSAANRPMSVGVVSSNGGKTQIIYPTLAADFPLEEQVVPQNVTLTADDGVQFHNQLLLPKDLKPGERRPAILFTHGGPGRQMMLGYPDPPFPHMAYAINQYFANRGYIVISVNYRGGIGYGEKFRTAPSRGVLGNSEYQDVLAAGRYLQSRPDVDPKRIGLWGFSYGGVLTAQGLARNSDIFAAGVDMSGIHLWGNSIDPNSVSYKSSSISDIGKWKSPVLLIHSDDDRNVAFSQTVGVVQLLRAHNIHHEVIVFPDDVHVALLFQHLLTSFNAADDFFNRFLGKESSRN